MYIKNRGTIIIDTFEIKMCQWNIEVKYQERSQFAQKGSKQKFCKTNLWYYDTDK